MARKPARRTGGEKDRPAKKQVGKRDVGSETTPDTRHVNAHESDPELIKDPLVGKTLGKCKIDKLLGEGRTAVVFRANFKPLKRTVAVKVLQDHMKKYPAVVRVFQQEGRNVAALDHENVLKIYDVGEDRGHHYLVLELLRGNDLLKLIEAEGGGLQVEDALEYARQASAGLAAAHRKKIIHRDIKPQNLVVEPDGTLKIVDFGLAAEAEGAFAGGRLGTPHYMAPEVCRGESAETASDIYALGITLFHMLVGHPPYHGMQSTEEIVSAHLAGGRLEPEKHRSGLPRGVADLIRRMTRTDPKARPTAKEIYETLTKLTPEKMAAKQRARRPRGTARRAAQRKSAPSTQIMAIGGVVVLLVIAVAFLMSGDEEPDAGSTWGRNPPPEPAEPADPEPEVPDKPVVPIDDALLARCNKLIAEARQEETTGNHLVALSLYHRVVKMARKGSAPYNEALAAYKALLPLVKKETGDEVDPEAEKKAPAHISVEESEAAGEEFASRKDELLSRLRQFDVSTVKLDLKSFVDRTRAASPERLAVEAVFERAVYVEELLKLAEARAGSLSGGDAVWASYDLMADPSIIVMGASEKGLAVKNEESKLETTKGWGSIPAQVLVSFLDRLRNPESAVESLWMGYFCQLIGDGRAEQYYEFALQLESGQEMRETIQGLRAAE